MPQDLSAVAWPARTARLSVRPMAPGDVADVWAYRRLPEVFDWLPHDYSDRARFEALMVDPDRLSRTLVLELEDRIVGDLYLAVSDAWGQGEVAEQARGTVAEIGWALHPAYAGRGYATEAATALLRLCFADLGVRRVRAVCFRANEPSWRLMERLGMRREEHTVRDSLHRTRGWLDGYAYALLEEEWSAGR